MGPDPNHDRNVWRFRREGQIAVHKSPVRMRFQRERREVAIEERERGCARFGNVRHRQNTP